MAKFKVLQNCNHNSKWYYKGEEAEVSTETLSAFGEGYFEPIEVKETKKEETKQDFKETIPNKKLKDIKTK